MIILLQRVRSASVEVENTVVAAIEQGLLALVGFEKADTQSQIKRMVQRMLGYRVFADSEGKMNRSLIDVGGALLLVPQFTLAADTRKGCRPSFSTALKPEHSFLAC